MFFCLLKKNPEWIEAKEVRKDARREKALFQFSFDMYIEVR